MNTSKLDAIRELLKTQSEKHVIQAVWSAYNITEAQAVRMVKQAQGIDTTDKGYPDPFLLATEWLSVEQNKPTGPYFECAGKEEGIHYTNTYTYLQACAMVVQGTQPVRNFRALMPPIVWPEMLNDGTENEAADQTPESYAWYAFPVCNDAVINNLNDKTDRAC